MHHKYHMCKTSELYLYYESNAMSVFVYNIFVVWMKTILNGLILFYRRRHVNTVHKKSINTLWSMQMSWIFHQVRLAHDIPFKVGNIAPSYPKYTIFCPHADGGDHFKAPKLVAWSSERRMKFNTYLHTASAAAGATTIHKQVETMTYWFLMLAKPLG